VLGAVTLVPVGGSPTGTGGSPVPPIFQTRSKRAFTAGHRSAGMEIEGRWVDVRDPEVLAELEKDQLS